MTQKQHEFRTAVQKIERRIAELGWDIPPTLYSLMWNRDLLLSMPESSDLSTADKAFREEISESPDSLTDFFQTEIRENQLADFLAKIFFPENVYGVVLAIEQLIVTRDNIDIPTDEKEFQEFRKNNSDIEEMRVVVGVNRDNDVWCLIRTRSHDDDSSVLSGTHLVEDYPQLLLHTLKGDHLDA